MSNHQADVIMSVQHVTKEFPIPNSSILPQNRKVLHATRDVTFDLHKGETLGIVGESGCGKSTLGRVMVGIEKPTSGSVLYKGADLYAMKRTELSKIRTQIQMIFQDPYASLNPRKRVIDILSEPMLYHGFVSKKENAKRVDELLDLVGLPKNAKLRYPHEFSGGQRQRITIARALSLNPEVIICDEPVSALDMSIQAQILNLLRSLQEELGLTYLFIAHGLGAVRYVSDRTGVMYLGEIVELGDADEIFHHPVHPYAKLLISAVPSPDPTKREEQTPVPDGEVPSAVDLPMGCKFHARCPFATDKCRSEEPKLQNISEGGKEHLVACWYAEKLK